MKHWEEIPQEIWADATFHTNLPTLLQMAQLGAPISARAASLVCAIYGKLDWRRLLPIMEQPKVQINFLYLYLMVGVVGREWLSATSKEVARRTKWVSLPANDLAQTFDGTAFSRLLQGMSMKFSGIITKILQEGFCKTKRAANHL